MPTVSSKARRSGTKRPFVWTRARVTAITVALIAVGIGAFFLTPGSTGSTTTDVYDQRPQDVTIKSCLVQNGRFKGSIEITNRSTAQLTYAVKVSFNDPAGTKQYATATTIVDQLDPGKSSGIKNLVVSRQVSTAAVTCQVEGAASYPS